MSTGKLISVANSLLRTAKANASLSWLAPKYFCDIGTKKNLHRNNNDAGLFHFAAVRGGISI
ncbi:MULTISPECIES: hypothetical protein [unclassified Janthinobacterium]|uniref:hypothetical protein n=1 Tax=unclassified Janthinobacterium TaxID=2610881 RepID=UPI00111C2221|nr:MULTISPECIES: hypothetical protein [unclassified Janthinobacterium]MCC7707176.1 hypothetical protein [Janthinobacterium sp. GW460W]